MVDSKNMVGKEEDNLGYLVERATVVVNQTCAVI